LKAKTGIIVAVMLALVSFGAAAAKTKVFEYTDAGFRLTWHKLVKITERTGDKDLIFEGSHGSIKLTAIVRKGPRIPASQHHFRLMSYFAGQWAMAEDDCRGTGWDECEPWTWQAESGDRTGLGEAGYGPNGTYIFVLSAPKGSFKAKRPAMRVVQHSIQLF
jgi:hypothetical protein